MINNLRVAEVAVSEAAPETPETLERIDLRTTSSFWVWKLRNRIDFN